jgi:hypothetical protein
MQWFILPHTFVPSYVNMVFDAIIFIIWSCHVSIVYLFLDWFVECLWFIRVVCWYGTILWCPLYLCVHVLNILGLVVCAKGRGSSARVTETWRREPKRCTYESKRTINLRLWLRKP